MSDVILNRFETWNLKKAEISLESAAGRVYTHMAGFCASKRCYSFGFRVAKLAGNVGICRRSAQYALRELEKAELLEFVSSGHEGSVYAVLHRVVGARIAHPPPGRLILDDRQCGEDWRWTGNSWKCRSLGADPAGRRKGCTQLGGGNISLNMAGTSLNKSETWYLKKAEISLESVAGRVYAHMAGQCSENSHRVRFIVAKVAEHVGVSKRSAQYALRKLEKANLLEFMFTNHEGSVYTVLKRVVGARVAHPPPGQLIPYDRQCRQHWRWTGNGWSLFR